MKAKKTLTEVATGMGVDRRVVWDLEHGRRAWTEELIGRYCNVLYRK